jgi:xylan 1,4-beta-xylosidase
MKWLNWLICVWLVAFGSDALAESNTTEVVIDAARVGGHIDLTRYALGQGGLSEKPMFDANVPQIAQLHPQTIRVFIQEFFNLYPAHGSYHWDTFDRFIETILATGAKPVLCLCFKPAVLFPKIDQHIVHPNSYAEWEELIVRMVKHCNEEKKFGIEYWEISNEPDIGEDGGCPYLFQKKEYVTYYQHTAAAVRRGDAKAKIGGPALAWYKSEIADALIEHCGNNDTPLNFFSWHVYASEPEFFRKTIRETKAKLAKFPKLQNCETIIDEWNMSLDRPHLEPAFQPAFILQTTLAFHEEGLSRSAYYHIRDFYVDGEVFSKFESPAGVALITNWWNIMPQYDGLWDHQGRVRPAYSAFKLLSLVRGLNIPIEGLTQELHGLAAKDANTINVVIWSFPESGQAVSREVTLRFPATKAGRFREIELNAQAARDELQLRRQGEVADLAQHPLSLTLKPFGVCWISIGP